MKSILMLEDGRKFEGNSLAGVQGERIGEVVFNTAVVGYQEMMTDPANAGKILVLTYPLIGNYGCAPKFNESNHVWLEGLIIKQSSRIFSNWQAKESFHDFLKRNSLLTISDIDTRTLAVHLRQKGQMLGIISTKSSDTKELLSKIEQFRNSGKESVLSRISTNKPFYLGDKKAKKRIAILDLGLNKGLVKQLEGLGLNLTVFPFDAAAEEILRFKPHGLIISNGPEEDLGLKDAVRTVKTLVGKVPMLGVSTGLQVLALALGGKLAKLKIGHRGVNYPIHHPASYKGEITVQNHSWVVDSDSLSGVKDLKITAHNLNDRTVEEMQSKKYKILGVQYYLSSPGFDEVNPVLKKFIQSLGRS